LKYNKKKAYKLSDAERKDAKEFVGCPIKRANIAVVLCGKMQSECRGKCEKMNMGNGCPFLDFTEATESWAKHLAKKANI
jgi:hypothetical protein